MSKVLLEAPTDTSRDALTENAAALERDLEWFAQVLDARLKRYFRTEDSKPDVKHDATEEAERDAELNPIAIAPPAAEDASPYASFLREHEVAPTTRLLILLALVPHVRPQLLDVLWTRNEAIGRGFTELGGAHGTSHGGFLPTGETAAFLIGGTDLTARFALARLFDGDGFLSRQGVLTLGPAAHGEPSLSGALQLSREHIELFTTGASRKPTFGADFPARRVHTELGWNDLVASQATLEQLEEIKSWVLHGETLLSEWGMRSRVRPGFTSLFHGPPGTGKTLAACMLGKHCGCDVYKIDLSMIVSKYIGETEKNLGKVFDLAEHKRWILFFDEADALFGKRTRVEDSHDRFANQEISFLLQRIEEFDGVVILASNFKANIDEAFLRRFQSVVAFPMPRPAERLRLWTDALPKKAKLERGVDLARLAEKHELSGGTITNVIRYAALLAIRRGTDVLALEHIEEGVRRELLKEGRVL